MSFLKNLFKNYSFLLIFSVILFCFFLISNVFSWTLPTANPPNNDLPPPLDTSSVEQTKSGNLILENNLTIGGILRLGRFSSHPTGTNGALYYNTTDNKFYGYSNDSWQELGSGSGGLWTLSGNDIYNTNSGNVGIGTQYPTSKLNVYGKTTLEIESSSDPALVVNQSGNSWIAAFYQNWQEKLIIDGSGNVGIGTTAPGAKLTVSAPDENVEIIIETTAATTDRYSGQHVYVYGAGHPYSGFYRAGGTKASPTAVAPNNTVGTFVFRAHTGTAFREIARFGARTDSNFSESDWEGYLYFSTSDGTTDQIERMRITASGNVGIGTTEPSQKLEVHGFSQFGYHGLVSIGRSANEHDYIGYNIVPTGTANVFNYKMDDTASALQFLSGGFRFRGAPSGTAGSQITFSDLMVIQQNGNVGIGTTSPSEKLTVSGNVLASAYYYSSDIRLKENIENLNSEEMLNKVLLLQGKRFNFKGDSQKQIGLIAQEIEPLFPELVKTDPQTGLKSIDYSRLVAVLIEAIKEQNKEINYFKNQCSQYHEIK